MTDFVFADDPSALVEAHYQQLSESRTGAAEGDNPRLQVAVVRFVRCENDWLGAVISPWAIQLILMNGDGRLWGDIPQGQRRYVSLPGGVLPFVADGDPEIGVWQYSSLIESVLQVSDMAAARLIAQDGLQMALGLPGAAAQRAVDTAKPPVSRRDFFRRLAGKRD